MNRALLLTLTAVYAVLSLVVLLVGLSLNRDVLLALGVVLCAAPAVLALQRRWPATLVGVFGAVLGFVPVAALPGTGTYVVLFLAPVAYLTALILPGDRYPRWGVLGLLMTVSIAVSLLSAVATLTGVNSLIEYAKWALASGLMLAALLMRDDLRRALAKAYVLGSCGGGLLSVLMTFADRDGKWLYALSFLGFGDPVVGNLRSVDVGGATVIRASGLYVDPNSAGLFLLFAFGLAGAVFTGARRVLAMVVLGVCITATLSRSAIATLFVALVIALVLSRIDAGRRLASLLWGGAMVIVVLLVPVVTGRLLDSFGADDVGTDARADALARYPGMMSGHWLFGRGWYLREFHDAAYAYQLNHVANTPLMVVYRGGVIAGVVFVVLLLAAIVIGMRAVHRGVPGAGVVGGTMIGLALVGFQLDFPVVIVPPLAMGLSLLLAEVQALTRDPHYRDPQNREGMASVPARPIGEAAEPARREPADPVALLGKAAAPRRKATGGLA